MPEPTAAPLVLALGLATAALGVAFGIAFMVVGGLLLTVGLGMWFAHLLPGKGHFHEPLVAPEFRPAAISASLGTVAELHPGVPGYRFRLPEEVHPISAGVKGGIVGGLLMPIPALAYGILSGHGIWYPINLLAGMVLPGMDQLTIEQLEAFRLDLFIASSLIHIVICLIVGLIYGVLMPTLPSLPRSVAWGGLLMPILWTGTMYLTIGLFNPLLSLGVDWPSFIVSQFLFGIVVAVVVQLDQRRHSMIAGLLGGLVGGLLMPLPAIVWAWSTGRTIWYPPNLLAAMIYPEMRSLSSQELQMFRTDWLVAAIAIHLAMTLSFGLVYGALLPRVTRIPGPLAWGGLVLPLVWTGMSYGLMGIVNPLMQQRVDWPWFVVSQFIFGIVAAIVVLRSEMVHIAPAGSGPAVDQEAATKWLTK
ncbi:hypothetical protein ETAA8_33260 [Anatilimnocola aggregata]|uniref:Uncharacterized protein n=1 Tax=Anatilimnocola aggregata TaxID=2528021 RepID=A0A517YDB3_9BACT|nr:hypothetical protein [Anatilimnocola aggregata]QDU28226.1 hypothetical protein ETAA8_33260 [Anatilimnocola aggregata]